MSQTLEELFEEFKKVPDWDRFPMPEVFYEHFKVKKPQPGAIMEVAVYNPPPYKSLNEGGKVEIRGPVEGGVRQIEALPPLPVEVKRLNDETGELEEYPPPKSRQEQLADYIRDLVRRNKELKDQTDGDTPEYLKIDWLSSPTKDNTTEIQPVSGPQ